MRMLVICVDRDNGENEVLMTRRFKISAEEAWVRRGWRRDSGSETEISTP